MKRIQALAALALGGALIAGCGGNRDQAEPTVEDTTPSPTTAPADMPPVPDTTAPAPDTGETMPPTGTDPYATPPPAPDQEPPPPSN